MIEDKQGNLDQDPQLLIAQALASETYRELAQSTAPMELSEVPSEVAESDSFRVVAEQFGWPDRTVDSAMSPRLEFADDDDFLHCLVDVGPGDPRFLNSFRAYLTTEPSQLIDGKVDRAEVMTNLLAIRYGTAPVLYRAYAVAPDLMTGLQKLCSSVEAYELDDYFHAHRDVARAARLAYELMGRLVKADDPSVHYELVGLPATEHKVTSIDDYLSA